MFLGDYLVPKMGITWSTFIKNTNGKISSQIDSIHGEDKKLGAYFVTGENLIKQGTSNEDESQKAQIFADKVLQYLWFDATALNHSVLFPKEITIFEDLETEFLNGKNVFSFGFDNGSR